MKRIIKILKKQKNFIHGDGASEQDIMEAEKKLSLFFADEYKEYLRTYGVVSYIGTELTGISQNPATNVVNVTAEKKGYNNNVSGDYYVIEDVGLDDIIIWQNESGRIYQTVGEGKPKEIASSLSEYIAMD